MRGVYGIRRRATGRIYVGSSVHIPQRWRGHRTLLKKGGHANFDLQADWNAVGPKGFDFVVLEHVPIDDLDFREQVHVDLNLENLYNRQVNIGSGRVAKGQDFLRRSDPWKDNRLYLDWATIEVGVEWDAAGRSRYDARDTDPGAAVIIEREFAAAVRVRAEELRTRKEIAPGS